MPGLGILLLVLYGWCLLLIFGFSLTQLHLTLLARRYYARPAAAAPPAPAPTQWPRVAVQLPLYNERYVVERVIDAAARLDYPAELNQFPWASRVYERKERTADGDPLR